MAAVERVNKFFEDATKLLSTGGLKLPNKMIPEINKLSTWLQKHQNESLPDGSKGKLFQTVEMFYRQCIGNIELRETLCDSVTNLVSTFLQMPEGKLIGAKDKKKLLNWLQVLSGEITADDSTPSSSTTTSITTWSVESIESKQQATLLNIHNDELWKENFKIKDKAIYDEIVRLQTGGEVETVLIDLDETDNSIVRVYSS